MWWRRTVGEDESALRFLLGSGYEFGVKFTYEIQDKPSGLPEAFVIGERFIDDDNVTLILGDNIWYNSENIFKIGITTSIIDRNSTYITGELYRGFYVKIYEFDVNPQKLKIIDNLFKKDFKYLNIYFDGGTEFYDRCNWRHDDECEKYSKFL